MSNVYKLAKACHKGDLEKVKKLVEQGVNIHADNEFALRIASECGYLELVKYLVEQGADVHHDQEKALYWATRNGRVKVVKYLVEQGANIDGTINIFRTACFYNKVEVVKYLVEHGVVDTHADIGHLLKTATEFKRWDAVSYLKNRMVLEKLQEI